MNLIVQGAFQQCTQNSILTFSRGNTFPSEFTETVKNEPKILPLLIDIYPLTCHNLVFPLPMGSTSNCIRRFRAYTPIV